MRHRNVRSQSTENSNISRAQKILKKVDVYPKLQKEFVVQTRTGATVSIITLILMIILFISEFRDYMTPMDHEHMVVDPSIGEKLRINFNVTFPALTCKEAHMNSMDVAGELQINMHQDVLKTRLSRSGRVVGNPMTHRSPVPSKLSADYCGSCMGASHPDGLKCCNTCDKLKEALMHVGWPVAKADKAEQCLRESTLEELQAQEGEGCRIHGSMKVNRVAGNFHVALGRTFHRDGNLVHQFVPGEQFSFNASHIIHSLSFGEPFPGMVNPLDQTTGIADLPGSVFQYYIKVVPTIYHSNKKVVRTNQFSFTKQVTVQSPHGRLTALPGTFFVFDLSPFMVKKESVYVPFTHFLTKICAIVGGVISVIGFFDSFLYHYGQSFKGKVVQ